MEYNIKVVVGQNEYLEDQSVEYIDYTTVRTPSVTDIELANNACSGTMEIGATASDRLQVRILNPDQNAFDGETVELWVQETEDSTESLADQIAEEVGTDTTDSVEYDDDEEEVADPDEEGEDLDPEDEADAEAVDEDMEAGLTEQLTGEEPDPETDVDPDPGEPSWERIGIFYTYEQTKNDDGSITLTCYDGFINMNGSFFPASTNATIADMYEDLRVQIRENCGIEVDEEEFGDYADISITIDFTLSYREAIGFFAGIRGGYAEFDGDGSCGISQYVFDENILIDSELRSYQETSAGEMTIEAVTCNRSRDGLTNDIIEAGEGGQDISFRNPFMTEEILQDIYDSYKGMRFTGAVTSSPWNSRMMAGEFVRIFSEDEYRNFLMLRNYLDQNSHSMTEEEIRKIQIEMDSLGRIILISSQVINFKGDATTTINSICDSEATKENKPLSPTDAKFRRVYADVIEAQELIAQKANITDLQAQNAVFSKVLAENVLVTELTGAKADFASLLAGDFSADQITALQAIFDQVTTGGLTADTINSVTGHFETLAAQTFTAEEVSAASAAFSKATIGALTIKRLETEYANIDFANVTTESVKNLFVNVGMLENAVISEGQITGTLAGVHVVADVIEANTIVAGDFVVQGQDENWYRINLAESGITQEQLEGLNVYDKYVSGEYIVAKSITADQIAVTDLYAFGATIAGLQLESGRIHSIGKTSVSSSAAGIYMDSQGQFNTGDASNFIASWYDATEQKWKVAIRADQISFGSGEDVQSVITGVKEIAENTLIYDHSYEYVRDSNNKPIRADFTAFLYRGGVDVKTEYTPASEYFYWYLKKEDKDGTVVEEPIGTGYYCSVDLEDCGYGAEVIGKFIMQDESEALTTDGDNLTTAEEEPLTVRATGDSVRVRDLTTTSTIFPAEKLMVVGAEDEHLITIQTLQDYLNANLDKQVLFDTTAGWSAQTTLVSKANTLYVYTDHQRDSGGNAIAGIKAGDGLAYVVDLPFTDAIATEHIADTTRHITTSERSAWNNHVSNGTIHVTASDKAKWDSAVKCYYAGTEQLVFAVV